MANADQLKALLKSHIEGDDSHFFAVAMQMAASEAKRGHGKLAQEIRALIDAAKAKKRTRFFSADTDHDPPWGAFLPALGYLS